MSKKIFRNQAINAQKTKWIGEVVLIRPFSFTILTICVAIICIMIILLLSFATYTKRTTVQGQLMPNTGLVRVFASEAGIVDQKLIQDGQQVKNNQTLYTLKMARYNSAGNYSDSVEDQIQLKKNSLEHDKNKISAMYTHSNAQDIAEISAIKQEINQIDAVIQQQQQRLNLAKDNVARYQSLLARDYISIEEYQLKQDYFLNQKLVLKSYERDRLAKSTELNSKEIALKNRALKLSTDLSNVDRQIASNQQDSIENKARNELILKAHTTGTVTSLNAQVGQQVSPNTPLASIVPADSILEAHLYLPSEAIGFIQLNQAVKLRFQAFPYQKFGQATGKVTSISDSTINTAELTNIGEFGGQLNLNQSQPIYLVKVQLDEQNIKAYGVKKALKVGMAFEADIMQETRKLYEWVLEPLYSISGKL